MKHKVFEYKTMLVNLIDDKIEILNNEGQSGWELVEEKCNNSLEPSLNLTFKRVWENE